MDRKNKYILWWLQYRGRNNISDMNQNIGFIQLKNCTELVILEYQWGTMCGDV